MEPVRSVFISYRRADAGWAANSVADALRRRLGPERLFLDNSSVELGAAFAEVIEDAIRRHQALIVLIGPLWDASPHVDRLREPQDWVRNEIMLAKSLDKLILPVLVDRRDGPVETALPDDLRFITRLQHAEIRQTHPHDVEDLAERITSKPRAPETSPTVGIERTRPALDSYLRHLLPPAQQWGGNRHRLVDLALAVLGRDDRLVFLTPGRLNDGPRGSAAVFVTGTDVVVVDVGEDFLIRGELRLPSSLIRRVEVVPTLPLFADVLLHTGSSTSVRLMGLFRDQARQLADHLRS